jgi:hypothetical protein
MKTRKNKINKRKTKSKTKGGVLWPDRYKSCADIKKDWENVWKHKPGYEKYNPNVFYPGKYNLINRLPTTLTQINNNKVECFEESNKDCAANKRDWEIFWSHNPKHAIYNPSTLYQGNYFKEPFLDGLTYDNGKRKSCYKGAPGEPPITSMQFNRKIKNTNLSTLPIN